MRRSIWITQFDPLRITHPHRRGETGPPKARFRATVHVNAGLASLVGQSQLVASSPSAPARKDPASPMDEKPSTLKTS